MIFNTMNETQDCYSCKIHFETVQIPQKETNFFVFIELIACYPLTFIIDYAGKLRNFQDKNLTLLFMYFV